MTKILARVSIKINKLSAFNLLCGKMVKCVVKWHIPLHANDVWAGVRSTLKGIHCFGGAEFESGVSWFTGGGNGDIESS